MVLERMCRCGSEALGAKGDSRGVSGNLIFSVYSQPRPPDFLSWFTLWMWESFTFSVPGAAAVRSVTASASHPGPNLAGA